MSFLGGKTAKPADTANTTPDDVVNNQLGQPVPMMAGTNKIALRWITPALNQFTRKSSGTTGKK